MLKTYTVKVADTDDPAKVFAGEVVTITVARPDGTTEVLTTTLDTNNLGVITADELPGVGYSAAAHIDADAVAVAADGVATFDVPKDNRTLDLQVT
jgi:hypothetical protein